jgi:hypothetical protein
MIDYAPQEFLDTQPSPSASGVFIHMRGCPTSVRVHSYLDPRFASLAIGGHVGHLLFAGLGEARAFATEILSQCDALERGAHE